MKIDFDQALDDCAGRIASGESNLDECLARYPEHAARLKPLLQAAARVERGRRLEPSPTFKARERTRLMAYVQTHPQRGSRANVFLTSSPVWRLGTALAVLVLAFFVTGTAFAQTALPGQALYGWKLSSERAWRAVSPDHVGVDLVLADRRAYEITVESSDVDGQAQAVKGYQEVLTRLTSETTPQNNERIINVLKVHQEKFSAAGVAVPELESLLSSSSGLSPAISVTRPSPGEQPIPLKSTPTPENSLNSAVPKGGTPGSIEVTPGPGLPALLPTQAHGKIPTLSSPDNLP